jgi:hypothetical protein
VSLYTDDFPVGLNVEASPIYEEWVNLKQEESQRSLLWAASVLARHSLTVKDYAPGIAILRRAVQSSPVTIQAQQ